MRTALLRRGGILSALPNALVLIALGAVGVWGHRTGWKAPAFSKLAAPATQQGAEDWCAEHNVPESRCVKCRPELLGETATGKDWCREHGVPESRCTICHPEILVKGVPDDWCAEHGVPESSCTLCNPEIAVTRPAPAAAGEMRVVREPVSQPASTQAREKHAHADEHVHEGEGRQKSHRAEASHEDHGHSHADGQQPHAHGSRKKDPSTCQTHALKVQFASPASMRRAGVRLGQAIERPMRSVITAAAEVEYDRTHMVHVSSPLSGRVWRVLRDVGQQVKPGDLLALIDAADVGRAKAELLERLADADLKEKTLARRQELAKSELRSQAELQEAEAALRVARVRLSGAQQALANLGLVIDSAKLRQLDEQQIRFLGLPSELVKEIADQTSSANLMPVRSPIEGTVITRAVVAGEMVDPNRAPSALFVVADTDRMWIHADMPQADAMRVRVGQPIIFRPDGAEDRSVDGKISWISTEVDDQTRTVRARAEVFNIDRQLLAHTFGTATIVVRDEPHAVVVPSQAIHWEGCCHIVFVLVKDDVFAIRKVKAGARDDYYTEIAIGLMPGEVVATTGGHVLKSEILKTALGAGCCGE